MRSKKEQEFLINLYEQTTGWKFQLNKLKNNSLQKIQSTSVKKGKYLKIANIEKKKFRRIFILENI